MESKVKMKVERDLKEKGGCLGRTLTGKIFSLGVLKKASRNRRISILAVNIRGIGLQILHPNGHSSCSSSSSQCPRF
jgi:hypothetical protein